MNILACVGPAQLGRLRAAAGDTHRVHAALDWAHAGSVMQRQPIAAVVADPAFGAASIPVPTPIQELRHAYPSTAFVLYSALDHRSLPAIAQLGRDGVEHWVVTDVDDDPRQLRALLERQPGVRLADELAAALAEKLKALPATVAAALERVIHTPSAFAGVPDLAAAANVSRRTIYRECERAALASPREIIAAARILRAYALLREGDKAIEDVAAALRFSSPHHLTKTMRWACGMTTARARAHIPPDAFVALLVERMLPTASRPSAS